MANAQPDFILWMVIDNGEGKKKTWIRFGAAWKASKGYSARVERQFAPFNDPDIGMAIMPYEPTKERDSNDSNRRGNRR
jgi:hypothetical protein